MNKSEQRAKKVSAAIAQARSQLTAFTIVQLISELNNFGCPYALHIPSILKKKEIISKNNGVYNFSKAQPIYYKTIQDELDSIVDITNNYVSKSIKKKKTSKVVTCSGDNAPVLTDGEMIRILKIKGYKIYQPITNYEEV